MKMTIIIVNSALKKLNIIVAVWFLQFYGILLVGFGAGILAGWDYIIQLEESFDDLISKSHSITGLFDVSEIQQLNNVTIYRRR